MDFEDTIFTATRKSMQSLCGTEWIADDVTGLLFNALLPSIILPKYYTILNI